jgi:hypothetical protein
MQTTLDDDLAHVPPYRASNMIKLKEGLRHLIIIAILLGFLRHFNIIYAPLNTCGCVNDTQWFHLQVLVLACLIGGWKDSILWLFVPSRQRDCTRLRLHRLFTSQFYVIVFALFSYQVASKVLPPGYTVACLLVQTLALEWLSVCSLSTDEEEGEKALS